MPNIKFKWISLEPDRRNYKPSRPVLEPQDIYIELDVPEEMTILPELPNEIRLTPEGMRYCIDQFEQVMDKKEVKDEDLDFGEVEDNEFEEFE